MRGFILVSLFLLLPAVTAAHFDGPYTVDGDVVISDGTYILNETLHVSGNLSLVNATLKPSETFKDRALLNVTGGMIYVENSSIIAGSDVIALFLNGADAFLTNAFLFDASIGISAFGDTDPSNLTLIRSSIRNATYGLWIEGSKAFISQSLIAHCNYGLTTSSSEVEVQDSTFLSNMFYAIRAISSTANISGSRFEDSGEGVAFISTRGGMTDSTFYDVSSGKCPPSCSGPIVSGASIYLFSSQLDISGVEMSSSDIGIYAIRSTFTVEDSSFSDTRRGIKGERSEAYISYSTFANISVGIFFQNKEPSYERNEFHNVSIQIKQTWSVILDIHDPYGQPVKEADVTFTDRFGAIYKDKSDFLGRVKIELQEYSYINGSRLSNSPYDVEIRKGDFVKIIEGLHINDNMEVNITLPYMKPDLKLDYVKVPSDVKKGRVEITVSVTNIGDYEARNVTITLTETNRWERVIDSTTVASIRPNETSLVILHWNADVGVYKITAYVDSQNEEIDETDAGNNRISTQVVVQSEEKGNSAFIVAVVATPIIVITLIVIIMSGKRRKA